MFANSSISLSDLKEALEIGSYLNFCSFTNSHVSGVEWGNFFSMFFIYKVIELMMKPIYSIK